MNGAQTQGNETQLTGKINEKLDTMTDDDLTVIAGTRDQPKGVLQQRHGSVKEQAERVLDEFMKRLNP